MVICVSEPISRLLTSQFFPLQINRASSMSNGSKKAKKREHHHVYDIPLDVPEGDDYLAIYETIDRKTNGNFFQNIFS